MSGNFKKLNEGIARHFKEDGLLEADAVADLWCFQTGLIHQTFLFRGGKAPWCLHEQNEW